MPLPSNGAMRMGADIGVEAGNTATAQISLGAETPRIIAQIPSGVIRCASDFYGKAFASFSLYAAGSNAYGTLGLGDTLNRSSPVKVGSTSDWNKISASGHSHAIKTNGTLWAWGQNYYIVYSQVGPETTYGGILGLGDTLDHRSSPVQIGSATDWAQVSGGEGGSAAIKKNGTLWVWGTRPLSDLGAPVLNPTQVGSLSNWSQVSCGRFNMLAVKTDGTLWAWGQNFYGQLGNGVAGNPGWRSSPVQIGTLTNWKEVSAGEYSTAAVKTDGTLWTWGNNGSGQLGDGTTVSKSSPIQIGTQTDWQKVIMGQYPPSALAIKTNGTLWSWGDNSNGQLALGTTINRSSPVQIGTLSDWSIISNGGFNVAAIKTNGTLWTWGSNNVGSLGDGTTVNKSSPVQIGSLSNWTGVAAQRGVLLATSR